MATIVQSNGSSPASRRKKKLLRRRLSYLAVLLIALGGGAYWWQARSHKGEDPLKNLPTTKVFRTTLSETVSATGTVTAQTGAEVKIGSQITGRIKRLYADVGSKVKAGQIIAELDLPDIQAQVQESEANLGQALDKLRQQEESVGMERTQTTEAVQNALQALRAARTRYESAVAASRMQPTQTRSDIQRSKAALNTALAQLNQTEKSHDLQIATARASITQAKANKENADANLKRLSQLFKQGYVAASDVDTATTQAQVADAQYQSALQSLQLTQAKADADVQTAREQVDQARAQLTSSQAGRFTDVMRQQDVQNAAAAVQQAQANLATAEAQLANNPMKLQDVAAAQAAVRQAEGQVAYSQAQLAKTYIRSPISGTVLQLAAQQGETLAAGLSAPTLIIVADLSRLQVDAYVDETDIGKVQIRQSVKVTVDAFPDRTFAGRVTKIASGSTLQQNVVTYDVAVAVKDPDRVLKPDMTASVTIDVGEHPNVLVVPSEAIKQDKTGSYLWVIPQGQKMPQRQDVETGASDGTYTEIKSGVTDGETVVLAGWPPEGGPGGFRMTPFGPRAGGHR